MPDHALVLSAGSDRAEVLIGHDRHTVQFHRRQGRPLPGDRVELDPAGHIAAIATRRNTFGRGGPGGRYQAIAANLDSLVIVIAPQPAPSPDLLHRYLAAARIQEIAVRVVVHKADLAEPAEPPFIHLDRLDVTTYRTRCLPEPALDGLDVDLAGGVHLLAGQSGVGKSTLANALVPELDARTRALSRSTGKGTHTTSAARLHPLPGDGWLVDTPGVWEYGLWHMEPAILARGFPEFRPYRGACRFRDCRHHTEPGCAIRAAAESGEIPEFRYQAWLRLLDEQRRIG